MKLLRLTVIILMVVSFYIQTKAQSPDEGLAKQLANPVANIISLPIQNNLDMGIGEYKGSRLISNVQPVIPLNLSEKWILITRTIVPIVSQYNISAPDNNEYGISDVVISGFLSPKSSKVIWGAGPVVMLPVGTDDYLTTKKWSVGPSVVVLMQKNAFTYGLLVNQIWSFAGDDERSDVNQAYFNPFIVYNWKSGGGIGLNFEWTENWEANTSSIYLTPVLSGVTSLGNQNVGLSIGPRIPIGSETPGDLGIRASLTFIFLKK